MSEQTPDPALEGAGLSATGTTADQMSPGDEGPGTTYGDPAGTATAEQELAEADADDVAEEGRSVDPAE